jgi:hypothetical protein
VARRGPALFLSVARHHGRSKCLVTAPIRDCQGSRDSSIWYGTHRLQIWTFALTATGYETSTGMFNSPVARRGPALSLSVARHHDRSKCLINAPICLINAPIPESPRNTRDTIVQDKHSNGKGHYQSCTSTSPRWALSRVRPFRPDYISFWALLAPPKVVNRWSSGKLRP